MKPFVVTVEGKEYDVDAPDEQTAWAWANEFHKNRPPEAPWYEGMARAVPRGLVGGLYTAAHGVGTVVGGLAGAVGATDTADRLFKENDELLKANRTWLDSKISPPQSFAGKATEAVSQLPAIMAGGVATIGPVVAGTGAQDIKQKVDMDVPPDVAGKSAMYQAAGMSALALVPQLKPLLSVITNVASGAAADYISSQILEEYKEAQAMHTPQSEEYWVNRVVDLVAGLAFSKRTPKQVKVDVDPDQVGKNLENIRKAPEPEPPPPQPIPQRQLDLPLEPPIVDTTSRVNPYDIGGEVTRLKGNMETGLDGQLGLFDADTPSPLRTAIEGAETRIDDQYSRIENIEDFAESWKAGRTSENVGLENKLLNDEYGKLDLLQRERAELGDTPTEVRAYSDAIRNLGTRKQSGALDLSVYSEGMKRFSRALSRLTDQSWVKAKFPPSEYMTNSDDTPLIMLHGTRGNFEHFRPYTLNNEAQGVHLGFTVPAHLITGANLNTSLASRKGTKNLLNPTKEMFSRFANEEYINIRPTVIKKGNYPYLMTDVGNWSPEYFIESTLIDRHGAHMSPLEFLNRYGTLQMSFLRFREYENQILRTLSGSEKAKLMNQFLKEFGIDGFFYANIAESLSNPFYGESGDPSSRYFRKGKSPATKTISFVTWNPDNVESLYSKGSVPASQRGGAKGTWNPYKAKLKLQSHIRDWRKGSDSFIEEVNKERVALEAIKPKLDIDKKQSVFEKAGLKGVQLIPEADPLTPQKLEELKAVPDIGNTTALAPGALAVAEHNNGNKAVLWFHKLLDSAWKRGQYYNREIIRPVEEQLKPLLRNDKAVLTMQKVFLEEAKRKSRFTKEELSQAGVPHQIIEVYEPFRKALDDAWTMQNAERVKLGMKEIPYEEAYISHRWNGPWTIGIYERVIGDNGKPTRGKAVTYIKENNKWAAKHAVDYLKNKGLLDENKYIVDEVRYVGGKGDSSPFRALYSDILSLLDENSVAAKEIREALKEEASLRTVNIGQQEKHFLKKSGAQGWRGNRPWANDENGFIKKALVGDSASDARDLFVQQIEYMRSAYMWASYQKSLTDARKLLSDEDFVKSHKNFTKWATDYARRHTGMGSKKAWSVFENAVAESLGTSTKTLESALGMSKGGFYAHTLGLGNIPFSLAQLLQPVFTSAKHNDLSFQGYDHNPVKTQLETLEYVAKSALIEGELVAGKTSFIWETADPLTKDMFAYMEANGMVDINPTTDITDLKMPEIASKATKFTSFNVVLTEKAARTVAFASFVSHLNQSGKFADTPEGRLEMFRKAEEATNYTMVDYRPQERAAIFDYMGLTGHALNTFTAFKFNFYSQLYSNILKAKQGNPMPLVYFLGTLYAMGGALGTIALDDADNLIDLAKAIGRWFKPLPRQVEEFSLKGTILKAPEVVAVGPVSALSGLNLYTRFSQADAIPLDPLNPVETFKDIFPYIGMGWDVASGIGDVSKYLALGGNKSDALAGGYRVTPPSLRGIYEEMVPGMKSGDYAQSVRDPALGGGTYQRTESDSTKRLFGFRSTDEALERERDYAAQEKNKFAAEQRNKIARTWRGNIILNAPQDSAKLIKRYIEWGGDADTLVADAQLNEAWLNRHKTYLDRLAAAADDKSKPAVDALITRLKMK